MRTVLQNPTRYHVMQKQKTQVRQFLNESIQSGSWDANNLSLNSTPADKSHYNYVRQYQLH